MAKNTIKKSDNDQTKNQTPNWRGEVETLSWLWWGKASQYEYEDNIFKIYDDIKGERILSFIYEII